MGLKKSDEKAGKKSEGLGYLVRSGDNATSSASGNLSAGALKGEELDKALHYVLDVHPPARFQELTTSSGGVAFPQVAQALETRLGQFHSEDIPESSEAPGRLGPKVMHVDRGSIFGRLALSADGLKVESQGNFSSCRANACVFAGKWMYEATLGTSGIQQIGWATLGCQFTNEEGVGDAADSYAFDGKRVRKWCVHPESYGQPWAPGDVIACCMDLDKGSLSFCRNGVSMGDAYPNVRILKPWLGYFPAISLSHGERCHLNFGSHPFRYPVEGYQPLQSQPSVDELAKIEYLWGCFSRLLEVTGSPQLDGRSSRLVPMSDLMMVPRPQMGVDDRVMLAAVIVAPLRSMLSCAYHIVESFIPFLREIAGRIDNMNTANLHLALNLLEITLGKAEFQRIIVSVIETLSHLCGSSTFQPKELPDTASYPHLKLMNALLLIPTIRKLFLRLPNVNRLIEGFLTRKQPTPMDLKELLPNVWYKGCKDDSASEERMNTVVKALSTALQKVEQSQFELMTVLLEEDRVSDVSVLVSSFNLLLRLLRPSLMRQPNGHSCLEEFPARELFVDGSFFPERCLHHDLPRLGGLLSHLQKEYPPLLAAGIPVNVQLDEEVGVALGGPPLTEEHLVPHRMVGKLLHILVLLYRLGIEVAMKMTLHQFQTEVVQRAHLLRLETRLASQSNESLFKKRLEDVLMHREEVVKSVRHCTWYKVVLFMPWKQECMFLLTVYLARTLSLLSSKHSEIFRYVPEAYVEALLDLFQAVAKIEPRFTDLENLESLGLQHIIGFLVRHFNHPMVVNPQLCDIILQGMAVLFADKQFLRACEKIQDAQETLVPDLLKTFDTRFWLSISNIILSVAKGTGFGQANGASSGGSSIFRQLLVITCREQPHLLEGFLNRLFNTLNWTVTELTVTFSEVDEQLERLAMAGASQGTTDVVRSYRKASVLFNLSINLLRLLELITWLMPHVFLNGSGLNLSRVVEVVGFLLSHLTVGSDARVFNKVVDAPQSWPEWKSKVSRPSILAPIAGILSSLHKSSKMRGMGTSSTVHQATDGASASVRRGRNSGMLWGSIGVVSGTVSGAVHHVQRALMRGWGGQRGSSHGDDDVHHTIARALAESMSAPQECLEHLGTIHWKQCFPHASSSKLSAELQDVIKAYRAEIERKDHVMDLGETDSPPEDFLDPILMTLMEDPVILPDSKITVDRCTIERHLLTQQTDPFSRAELTKDMVLPNVELRQRIHEWQESKIPK